MALTSFSGTRVRKHDVVIAKNYLTKDEIDTLNRLVVIFLEQADLRVKQRKELTLDFWRSNVDRMLEFNDQPVLEGAGRSATTRWSASRAPATPHLTKTGAPPKRLKRTPRI